MKKYLLPKEGQYYKACLHCHSTVSDGALTPEEIKREAMKKGFSIVAFTDHEVLVDHSDLTDGNFLALNGYEMGTEDDHADDAPFATMKSTHFSFIAKDEKNLDQVRFDPRRVWGGKYEEFLADNAGKIKRQEKTVKREYSLEEFNAEIKEGNENGFLVAYNHPAWSLHNYDDFKGYEGLWAVEVFNGASNERCGIKENATVYDDLLSLDKRLNCLATDDVHLPCDLGVGWVMVKAMSLDYKSIIDALERGDFYSSTGPEIKEVYLEDNFLHVKTSPVRKIIVHSSGRKKYCVKDTTGEGVTEAVIEIPRTYRQYFRISVDGFNGTEAWTNAHYLEY